MDRRLFCAALSTLVCALAAGAAPAGKPRRDAPLPPPAPPQVANLPVTLEDGNLSLTIKEMTTGLFGPDTNSPPKEDELWTRLEIHIDWRDRPKKAVLNSWQLKKIVLSTAAGAEWSPNATSGSMDGRGNGFIAFVQPKWPLDQPWRFHIEMARTTTAFDGKPWDPFYPEELWVVKSIPIPAPGTNNTFHAAARSGEVSAEVIGVAGASTRFPDDFGQPFDHPLIQTRFEAPEQYHLNLLSALDPAGREIDRGAGSEGFGQKVRRQALGLKVPPGVRSVNLAFAVHRSRVFETMLVPSSP
jgi:hypothetical protein